jgi:riboflavin synthase
MFTGLVEAKGNLVRRTSRGADARLVLAGQLVRDDRTDAIMLGESIAIDGVCLTVDVIIEPGRPGVPTVFEVDASSETLAKTTLGELATSAAVNLERALPIGARLGGHIVSGHVDGVGRIAEVKPVSGALQVRIEAPADLARYIAEKGSIAMSGVSLTVNAVTGSTFDVMLIPHTREKTSLDALAVGTRVNLEVDILARYVARLLEVGRSAPEAGAGANEADSRLLERLTASGYV